MKTENKIITLIRRESIARMSFFLTNSIYMVVMMISIVKCEKIYSNSMKDTDIAFCTIRKFISDRRGTNYTPEDAYVICTNGVI